MCVCVCVCIAVSVQWKLNKYIATGQFCAYLENSVNSAHHIARLEHYNVNILFAKATSVTTDNKNAAMLLGLRWLEPKYSCTK